MAESDDPPPKLTPAERAQRKRDEKLADMQSEIDSGRMTVRKMTDKEKAAFDKRREERPPRSRKGR